MMKSVKKIKNEEEEEMKVRNNAKSSSNQLSENLATQSENWVFVYLFQDLVYTCICMRKYMNIWDTIYIFVTHGASKNKQTFFNKLNIPN